jgi:hypothetical protein
MALEFVGKLVKKMPEQSGQSKNGAWKRQDFLLETTEQQYSKKALFSAWGDKVDALDQYSIGDILKVYFNIEAREYNERWYNDVKIWKVEAASGATSTKADKKGNSPLPDFPEVSTFESSSDDNLPF